MKYLYGIYAVGVTIALFAICLATVASTLWALICFAQWMWLPVDSLHLAMRIGASIGFVFSLIYLLADDGREEIASQMDDFERHRADKRAKS